MFFRKMAHILLIAALLTLSFHSKKISSVIIFHICLCRPSKKIKEVLLFVPNAFYYHIALLLIDELYLKMTLRPHLKIFI